MSLEFLILGPFQVSHNQQPLALGGPRQRAVLALLLLNRREVVTPDRMIDELWGEHPPATVGKAIHVYVSNLRKVVGDGVLLTRDGGYKLHVEPHQVDADRFDGLVARGRTALEDGYPVMARQRLREALDLWRGRPLAEFSYHQFAHADIARLEEARIAALEDRIAAELALGAHAALVPELETHVRAHPARERLWGQLMVALYRSGRQADALERYRRARRILIDQFAIEPGRDLREIERAVLAQDPALDAPALEPAARREGTHSTRDWSPDLAPRPPSADESLAAGDTEAKSERPPPAPIEPRGGATAASRPVPRVLSLSALGSSLEGVRRAIDTHWHEQWLAIAAGAALLLIAVIAVAVLTSAAGSGGRPGAQSRAGGCSRCVASISAPRTGGIYAVGQSVITSFSCADSARGGPVVSCNDSTGSHTRAGGHGRLRTSTPGTHTYTVTLTVRGGATKATTVFYRVVAPLATSIETLSAIVAHHSARITLRCSGGLPGARCGGILKLKIRRLIHGHVLLAGIARARYATPSGGSGSVVLRLTHHGMRALRQAAGHHRIAQLIVIRSGGSPLKTMIRLQLG